MKNESLARGHFGTESGVKSLEVEKIAGGLIRFRVGNSFVVVSEKTDFLEMADLFEAAAKKIRGEMD